MDIGKLRFIEKPERQRVRIKLTPDMTPKPVLFDVHMECRDWSKLNIKF